MRYVIVDDEPISHQIIEAYAGNLPFMELVGNCYDAISALELLGKVEADLLFLDVRMPKLGGFDFLRTLKQRPHVIAVSAHADHALEGYELDLCDYLLKPFDFERFLRAVNKVWDSLDGSSGQAEPERHESLFLKDGKKHHQVRLDEILYIEASGNYCLVYLSTGKRIMTSEKISDLASRLPSVFVRTHKSYIVATRHIQMVEGEELHIGKNRIPVGRVYKSNITKLLNG